MTDQPLLFSFLAVRDVPCPVCRYNLRGLRRETCPECDAPLRLDVASPSLRLGPYLFTIVSFALGAGFDLVIAMMLGVMTIGQAAFGPPGMWMRTAIVCGLLASAGLLCVGLILLMARERARWYRVGVAWQRIVAGAVFVMVGLGHLWIGVMIVHLL